MDGCVTHHVSTTQCTTHCLSALYAGHATTARLVTWTMFLLAVHPDWQHRLRSEADAVMGREGEQAHSDACDMEVQWEQVQRLTDMACVLNESLRLFPPIPAIGRTCVKVRGKKDRS